MPAPGELVFASPRRAKPPRHLADLDPSQRREVVAALGEKPFRAGQLSAHYFTRLADDPAQLTDLPRASRALLAEALLPRLLTPVRELECDGGMTRKTLWRLFDGALVESVLMRYPDRVTMCVSSQAGCGMNCPFCATGQAGLTRSMSSAEIVEQVVAGARRLAATGGQRLGDLSGHRISNVVFMGMGEPMANYRAVVGAVRRLTEPKPDGFGLSARGITVSTVGLVPAMAKLAEEGLAVRLAVSLHAPDDELRDELVPVNTRWKVREVLAAAWHYAAISKRRVSIEYALIKDVNDQAWRADLLGKLLRGHPVHVNLIPLNPTPGSRWTASRPHDQRRIRPTARDARCPGHGARHPRTGDRRRLRSAGRHRTLMRRFPTVTGLTRGYDRRQVDVFLALIEDRLDGPGAADPVSTDDIRRVGFDLVHGGYAVAAVDACLDEIEERTLRAERDRPARRRGRPPGDILELMRSVLAAPRGARVTRCGPLRLGYLPSDVDTYLERLPRALARGRRADGGQRAAHDVPSPARRLRRGERG